jgi:hypothetical protein
MADNPIDAQPEQAVITKQPEKIKGITFIIMNTAAMAIIPISMVAAVVTAVLLKPEFYTAILKNGRIITAFVEAKNWQTDRAINDEIERSLDLGGFTAEFEKTKARYERAKDTYSKISRNDAKDTLKKQRREVADIEWKQVKYLFPDSDLFEKNRAAELKKIDEQLDRIETYQDNNSDKIKTSKKDMEKALSVYEDSLSTLEDKKKEAGKIIEKHKNTLESSIYDDLEIIERPLSQILNARLIDGAVKITIEKIIKFLTSYAVQVEKKNIYFEYTFDANAMGRRSLAVKLPELEISLLVEGDGHEKKHVLSQLLADEIDKLYNLRNRTLLTTMFRLSDSSLGEYFGGKYLAKLGLIIEGGNIRRPAVVLRGEAAEHTKLIMRLLSWGQYLYIAAVGLVIFYIAFLFFSAVDRLRKLAALKRLLIYPSMLILAACGLLLWSSLNIFEYYPDFIENISIRSFAKHLSFTAAWYLAIPLLIVFGTALVAGLGIRKYLVRREN